MSRYTFRIKAKRENGEVFVDYKERFIDNLFDLQDFKHELRREFNQRGYKDVSISVRKTTTNELFGI